WESNLLQSAGSHLLVVGVGGALDSSSSRARLRAVSGPDRLEGPNGILGDGDDVPFAKADWTLVRDFDALASRVNDFARELRSPSRNTTNRVQTTGGATVPGQGVTSPAALAPAAGTWQNPVLPPASAVASITTGANG